MLPPQIEHQRLIGRLFRIVDDLKPDGEVLLSPIEVCLDNYNIAQPDLVWIAAKSACQIEALRLVGAPDLVIEVLSPATAKRDKTTKFRLYEQHGTREYWIIDPEYSQIEVWKRGENGFERQGIYTVSDTFEAAALSKPLEVTPIFS